MVIPLKRRVTKQTARKGASRTGFAPLAQLLCCAPCEWPPALDAARAAHLRPVAAETRPMDITEAVSLQKFLICLLFPFHKRDETDASERHLFEMIVELEQHDQVLRTGRAHRHDQPAAGGELVKQFLR